VSNELMRSGHVVVSNPAEYYVPGMFTVRPVSEKEKFSDFSDEEVHDFAHTERHLRSGLKALFNVALAGMYVEAHSDQPVTGYTIPFHIDRLEDQFNVGVYQPHIAEYLTSYSIVDMPKQEQVAAAVREYLLAQPDMAESYKSDIPERQLEKPQLHEVRDIDDESELPHPPEGMKYYVCLGGSKNFQAFLTEGTLSKGEFLDVFGDELDEVLQPVYEDETLVVRQDAKYAIPGFYIVSPKAHYRSIDEMPEETLAHSLLTTRRITQQLKTLGIEDSHIYHDEKYQSPASAHFWILPLHQQTGERPLNRTIFSRDIWTYLETYARFGKTGKDIAQYNQRMRELLRSPES